MWHTAATAGQTVDSLSTPGTDDRTFLQLSLWINCFSHEMTQSLYLRKVIPFYDGICKCCTSFVSKIGPGSFITLVNGVIITISKQCSLLALLVIMHSCSVDILHVDYTLVDVLFRGLVHRSSVASSFSVLQCPTCRHLVWRWLW